MAGDRPDRRSVRRYAEAAVFVAVWVALGYLLPASAEGYLLLGIPLTVIFQLLVRRRPLRELWVRGAARFRLGRGGVALACGLALVPASYGIQSVAGRDWVLVAWWAAAAGGAGLAAFALRATSVRAVLACAALPGAIASLGWILVLGGIHVLEASPVRPAEASMAFLKYLAIYFPLTFVLEEVTFRGALDPHVQPERGTGEWLSALFVSALWGLWHLPVSGEPASAVLVLRLLAWHALVGVPLSFAWRRSGNLAGPALAHAVGDAVRNALLIDL